MDLGESPASGQESDQSHGRQDRESLEQVPACIVEEEDSLDANDRSDEQRVRHRGVGESLGDVVDVASEVEPLQHRSVWLDTTGHLSTYCSKQRGHSRQYGAHEEQADDDIGAFGVVAEDVVDLREFPVSQGLLGRGKCHVRVKFDGEGECRTVVACRGAERCNHYACGERRSASQ